MKVIALAATKGGVGKSTLTCALAVAAIEDGLSVALIDADPLGTTRDWHTLRGNPDNPHLFDADTIAASIAEADARGCDWVFIDTPPAFITLIEPAVRAADLVLIPVRPSPVDLLAIDPIAGLCDLHNRPWAFVLNQVPPRTTFADDATKHLKKVGRVAISGVGTRNAFAMAMAGGKTGAEIDRPDGKCREDTAALWREVKRLARTSR